MVSRRKDIIHTEKAFDERMHALKVQTMQRGTIIGTWNADTGIDGNLAGIVVQPPERKPLKDSGGVIETDGLGVITDMPDDLVCTLGYQVGNVIGKRFNELLFTDPHDPVDITRLEGISKLITGEELEIHETIRFRDKWGRPLHALAGFSLRDDRQGFSIEYMEVPARHWELMAVGA